MYRFEKNSRESECDERDRVIRTRLSLFFPPPLLSFRSFFFVFSQLKIFDEVNDGYRVHVQLSVIIVYLPLRGREPQTRR